MDAMKELADAIRVGTKVEGDLRDRIEALFGSGGAFHSRHLQQTGVRDAYSLGGESGTKVPFAGLLNPDNPPSGPYGGTSVVWFPTEEHGSLIVFVVGTRGLSPDEGILMRPGHRRRIAALRRWLARQGVEAWTKPDPAALGMAVPKTVRGRFDGFEAVFKRYGSEIYAAATVPEDLDAAHRVVQAFIDLYAYERGWTPLKAHEAEFDELIGTLRGAIFPQHDATAVDALLRERRFVVLQGPPGTGKTRLAKEILRDRFGGRGMTVQFHPAVTYEDFVVGLSPDTESGTLRFGVRRGWLLEAIEMAEQGPTLLVIDEINRADLGKVLGEAIYLFEAREVGGRDGHRVALPHPYDGRSSLEIPPDLFVLGTMNTADRSIAHLDIAVRRRFAFVPMHPDRRVVEEHAPEGALEVFDQVADVFVEHAPGETLHLLPGHAYYLAEDRAELDRRFRYELIPLLDEYLEQGLLGPAASELHAVRDAIEDRLEVDG